MTTILNEKEISIKDLEQNIFKIACEWASAMTQQILHNIDHTLQESRDKAKYRHKGKKKTSLKTVYGVVEYKRAIYESINDDGIKSYTYLLDEYLGLRDFGFISPNLVQLLTTNITELSYRGCAKNITEQTNLSISHMGVWNIVQTLGKKVADEEKNLAKAHKNTPLIGKEETKVLFEEVDGVYINLQGKDAKNRKDKKAEMKVGIAYTGWRKTGKDRYALEGKVVTAAFAKAKEFHAYREAGIAKKYNLDEVQVRLLNGDGANWIKKPVEKETVLQLDPYHRNRAILQHIPYDLAREEIYHYLQNKDLDGLFSYLEKYINSLYDEKEIEKANELLKYFRNNRSGLLPYQVRVDDLPSPPGDLLYRNMGAMENHIWSVIAKRMKNNHTSWSFKGANHLAKILALKSSGRLHELMLPLEKPRIEQCFVDEAFEVCTTPRDIKASIGKGYQYPTTGHLVGLETYKRGTGVFFKKLAGM